MSKEILQQALALSQNRKYGEAIELLKPLLHLDSPEKDAESTEEREIQEEIQEQAGDDYFMALKLYADILGPMTGSDHILAIDLYQKIINEAESDDLYNAAQAAILKSNLMLAIHFMEAFENTLDIIAVNEEDQHFIQDLIQQRESFIIKRAESIYKNRL